MLEPRFFCFFSFSFVSKSLLFSRVTKVIHIKFVETTNSFGESPTPYILLYKRSRLPTISGKHSLCLIPPTGRCLIIIVQLFELGETIKIYTNTRKSPCLLKVEWIVVNSKSINESQKTLIMKKKKTEHSRALCKKLP